MVWAWACGKSKFHLIIVSWIDLEANARVSMAWVTRKNSIFDKWIRKPLKIQWFWDEKLIFLFYFLSYISISVLYHNREEEHCMRFQHTTVLTSMSPNYDSSVLSPLKNLKLQDPKQIFWKILCSSFLFFSSCMVHFWLRFKLLLLHYH